LKNFVGVDSWIDGIYLLFPKRKIYAIFGRKTKRNGKKIIVFAIKIITLISSRISR
jgi:hypothetical protein